MGATNQRRTEMSDDTTSVSRSELIQFRAFRFELEAWREQCAVEAGFDPSICEVGGDFPVLDNFSKWLRDQLNEAVPSDVKLRHWGNGPKPKGETE